MGGRRKYVMDISARGNTPVGEYKNEDVRKMGVDGKARVSEWFEG